MLVLSTSDTPEKTTTNPFICPKRYMWNMIGVTNATKKKGIDYLLPPAERVNGLGGSEWVHMRAWK